MKVKELCNYCEGIEADCDICKHKKECEELEAKLSYISAFGLKELYENNEEL